MNVLGPRIRIRPTRHEDLPFIKSLWNDGTVMRYKGYPNGMQITDESMERWWSTTPHSAKANLTLSPLATPHCTIELLDGTPIGELSYSNDAHRRAHIDLTLSKAYWEKGYATEALTMAIRELFASTPIATVLVEPSPDNEDAHRLHRRCGFHPAPTENHPHRWECSRVDFADRAKGVHMDRQDKQDSHLRAGI